MHLNRLLRIIPVLFVVGIQARAEGQRNSLTSGEEGMEYGRARRQLIKEGNSPVDQTHSADRFCGISHARECTLYPEFSACAVDQPLCRFEWRSKAGRRFYIITVGENPLNRTVSGMQYE